MKKIKTYIIAHKILSTVGLIIILMFGYWTVKAFTGTATETRYVVAAVQKGTIVSTVTGTGQVSASNQFDLKSKASGDIIYLGVASGQEVKAGTVIAKIDPRDAASALESAQIALEKLTSVDTISLTQSQNALADSQESLSKSQDALAGYYTSGLNDVASTFVDIPTIINGLRSMFYSSSGFLNDQNTVYLGDEVRKDRSDAGINFDNAQNEYVINLSDYKAVSVSISTSSIEKMIDETYKTTLDLVQAVKDAKNTVDLIQNRNYKTPQGDPTSTQNDLNGWLSKLTGHVSDLLSVKNNIQNTKIALESGGRDVYEKQQSLTQLQNGGNPLDLKTQQLNVQQKQQAYEDYFIRAPFDGVVAKLSIKNGDPVSSGTSIGTFISKDQVADISLNEIDISKIKLGQNVTLTFDAVDGLTLTGKVVSMDLVGTVTQGVVTYNVKIAFDTTDPRVLSGMSVSASIATAVERDVLIVPNSAIKAQGTNHYVEVLDPSTPISTDTTGITSTTLPEQRPVEIGISDDLSTEIISGLVEGDKIVTKTTTAAVAKTATTQAPSLFGAIGGRTTGGGAARTGAVRGN